MTKKICISLSDWVFNEYVAGVKSNRSKFIEEMLVKGVESETGEVEIKKAKLATLIQDLKNKDHEIKRLSFENGNLKQKVSVKENKEQSQREKAMHDTVRRKWNNLLDEEESK